MVAHYAEMGLLGCWLVARGCGVIGAIASDGVGVEIRVLRRVGRS